MTSEQNVMRAVQAMFDLGLTSTEVRGTMETLVKTMEDEEREVDCHPKTADHGMSVSDVTTLVGDYTAAYIKCVQRIEAAWATDAALTCSSMIKLHNKFVQSMRMLISIGTAATIIAAKQIEILDKGLLSFFMELTGLYSDDWCAY